MSVNEHPITFHLEIPIGPKWRNIELLRSACLNCIVAVFEDHEPGNVVGMVASELLENAVKYGDWTRPGQPYLNLRVRGTKQSVVIDVASPVAPASDHYATLRATLDRIRTFPTRRDAYLARMREIAEQPAGSGISRMGLVRIAYEGACRIEARLTEDDMLHIIATVEPPGSLAPPSL